MTAGVFKIQTYVLQDFGSHRLRGLVQRSTVVGVCLL